MPRPLGLLTDFGYTDAYVGVMKAVVYRRIPNVVLFDLTHGVPPQNIRAGALQLLSAVDYAPEDTVFLAVVDPGVGSDRRPVCMRSGGRFFVGPDNGLLWPAAAQVGVPEAWALDRPEHWLPRTGATFHGRDVFAPAAALLAAGADPDSLGTRIADPVRLSLPKAERDGSLLRGEIILVDGFGNAITNLRAADLAGSTGGSARFGIRGVELLGPASHYGAVSPGTPLVVLGSLGFYEIAVRDSSAADALGLREGDPVTVRTEGGSGSC